jgi:uncharacterized repeat protein (TIGR04138 family)
VAAAERDPEQVVREICAKDPRYPPAAYQFLFEALEYTIRRIGVRRHVSGSELCRGIADFARLRFGGLARMVFRHWGIHTTEDFGHMVFNLVEAGLWSKTEKDSIEDFRSVYSFDREFPLDAP